MIETEGEMSKLEAWIAKQDEVKKEATESVLGQQVWIPQSLTYLDQSLKVIKEMKEALDWYQNSAPRVYENRFIPMKANLALEMDPEEL